MNIIEIPVVPIGKPRMTQRDKWKQRDCVEQYRFFCDLVRLYTKGKISMNIDNLSWIAYFPIPKSWSKKKKAEMTGALHRQKPDRDNVDKAILDALMKEDCAVAHGYIEKRWDDGNGPRIKLYWEDGQMGEQWQYPEERRQADDEDRLRRMGYYDKNYIDYFRYPDMATANVMVQGAETRDRVSKME